MQQIPRFREKREGLSRRGLFDEKMGSGSKGMVSFRNVLVYEYTKIDIMINIIENHLNNLKDFAQKGCFIIC